MNDHVQALLQLLAKFTANLELEELSEANALVVEVYDPETDRRWLRGPFPTDTTDALAYVEAYVQPDNDVPMVLTVRPLVSP